MELLNKQETMSLEKKKEEENGVKNNNTSFMQVFKSMSRLNLVYTVFIFFSYFGYGITVNIWGLFFLSYLFEKINGSFF